MWLVFVPSSLLGSHPGSRSAHFTGKFVSNRSSQEACAVQAVFVADEGYLTLTASNGAEALGVAASNHVDLVVLDLNMPGQGGWDTFEKLTAKNPLLAVIIITAKPNQLFTSLGAGVGALLEKPLDYPILLQTIAALLAESGELRLARLTGRQSRLHYVPSTCPGEVYGISA